MFEKHEAWKKDQKNMESKKMVFLNKSSTNSGMNRLYDRTIGETRVNEYVPDFRFEKISIISGVSLNSVVASMIFKGTIRCRCKTF
jgi:hypothetical protein